MENSLTKKRYPPLSTLMVHFVVQILFAFFRPSIIVDSDLVNPVRSPVRSRCK